MIELNQKQYEAVRVLAEANACEKVYPYSIIEGNQQGRIFVDSTQDINTALFWHYCGFAHLAGAPNQKFLEDVIRLVKREYEKEQRACILHINEPEWITYFSDIEEVKKKERYVFSFNKEKYTPCHKVLRNDFSIQEIDRAILLGLKGRIIPSFSWDSNEAFLKKGKGFVVLHQSEIVTVVFSAAVGNGQVDIGIETNEKYRGQGFGKMIASKMIESILLHNDEPVWGCDLYNKGSKAIAEAVGFEVIKTHPVFFI